MAGSFISVAMTHLRSHLGSGYPMLRMNTRLWRCCPSPVTFDLVLPGVVWVDVELGHHTCRRCRPSNPCGTSFGTSQVTLRRLSEALRSIDLQALSQDSQLEIGLGLDTLDASSADSINTSLEVKGFCSLNPPGIHCSGRMHRLHVCLWPPMKLFFRVICFSVKGEAFSALACLIGPIAQNTRRADERTGYPVPTPEPREERLFFSVFRVSSSIFSG